MERTTSANVRSENNAADPLLTPDFSAEGSVHTAETSSRPGSPACSEAESTADTEYTVYEDDPAERINITTCSIGQKLGSYTFSRVDNVSDERARASTPSIDFVVEDPLVKIKVKSRTDEPVSTFIIRRDRPILELTNPESGRTYVLSSELSVGETDQATSIEPVLKWEYRPSSPDLDPQEGEIETLDGLLDCFWSDAGIESSFIGLLHLRDAPRWKHIDLLSGALLLWDDESQNWATRSLETMKGDGWEGRLAYPSPETTSSPPIDLDQAAH